MASASGFTGIIHHDAEYLKQAPELHRSMVSEYTGRMHLHREHMSEDRTRRNGRPTLDRSKGAKGKRPSTSTTFGQAVSVCGLSHEEAAAYLGRSRQSIRAYASGARKPPLEILDRLTLLWEQISFRTEPKNPLPPSAQARRDALQEMRTRAWWSRERSAAALEDEEDDEDDEDEEEI
jgi:transcriptional regulator with XRE-family HTH domain